MWRLLRDRCGQRSLALKSRRRRRNQYSDYSHSLERQKSLQGKISLGCTPRPPFLSCSENWIHLASLLTDSSCKQSATCKATAESVQCGYSQVVLKPISSFGNKRLLCKSWTTHLSLLRGTKIRFWLWISLSLVDWGWFGAGWEMLLEWKTIELKTTRMPDFETAIANGHSKLAPLPLWIVLSRRWLCSGEKRWKIAFVWLCPKFGLEFCFWFVLKSGRRLWLAWWILQSI